MSDRKKCARGPCKCEAPAEGDYCSQHCEEASSHGIEREFCECGHPPCQKRRPAKPVAK